MIEGAKKNSPTFALKKLSVKKKKSYVGIKKIWIFLDVDSFQWR
jgi:hypothetical protein